MAYTIGASHGPFTGNGSFAISKPAGIRSILTGIPSWTGHDGNIPRRYFKLGRMSLGNPHGFQFSHGLEYVQQLLYPIAPVWEILAYDIRDGASCTFYELVDVPDLSLKQPWDRSPLSIVGSSNWALAGSGALSVGLSYVVPVGRRMMISNLTVSMQRITASASPGATGGFWYVDEVLAGAMTLDSNVVGVSDRLQIGHAAGILLGPTKRIQFLYQASETGTINVRASYNGFLFDA